MSFLRAISTTVLWPTLILIAGACAQPAAAPTLPPATPTKPPAAATPAATQPAAATPQVATTPTSAPPSPAKPIATAAPSGGVSISDLANKAKGATEYSVNLMTLLPPGKVVYSKNYVKGSKMRAEDTVGSLRSVTLTDLSTKVGYMLLADQKTAQKTDESKAAAIAENAGEYILRSLLPSDSTFVGTETVDGKPAAVYDVPMPQHFTKRVWIWIERGLPLKAEGRMPVGSFLRLYTHYQFGPQPDTLFELPPGTQVVENP